MLLCIVLALLFQYASLVGTVPAALQPPVLFNEDQLDLGLAENSSNAKSDAGTSISFPHNSSLSELEIPEITFFRVPDTNLTLVIGIFNEQIEKADLGRTILQTQLEVKSFIDQYGATLNMDRLDDPFESDELHTGCFFGLKSYPPDYKHLTCGMLADVLQGIWLYLYRGDRSRTTVFEVRDDTWGRVGVGKVSRDRMPDYPPLLGHGNDTGNYA